VVYDATAGRIADGQQLLYDFNEGSGNTLVDSTGQGGDLTIEDPGALQWLPGGLQVTNETALVAEIESLTNALTASNEVTIEAWITPDSLTQGPASIVSISLESGNPSISLGQNGNTYSVTSVNSSGNTTVTAPVGTLTSGLTHVVFTLGTDSILHIYINGSELVSASLGNDFTSWNENFRLVLANDMSSNHPWLGTFQLVSVYDVALQNYEVAQNYAAGAEGNALALLAQGGVKASASGDYLRANELEAMVEKAVQRWLDSGQVSAEAVTHLGGLRIEVVDLPGALLGQYTGDAIRIDTDAAGYGWFVDPTPDTDEEFTLATLEGTLKSTSTSSAYGEMDLLSVLSHELGHALDLVHGDEGMIASLEAGERELPITDSGDEQIDVVTAEAILAQLDIEVIRFESQVFYVANIQKGFSETPEASRESTLTIKAPERNGHSDNGKPRFDDPTPLVRQVAKKGDTESDVGENMPSIEWDWSPAATFALEVPEDSDSWVKDFVLNLAGQDGERPNDNLEIAMPQDAVAPANRNEED
jgi:hypothetical protein